MKIKWRRQTKYNECAGADGRTTHSVAACKAPLKPGQASVWQFVAWRLKTGYPHVAPSCILGIFNTAQDARRACNNDIIARAK